MINAIILSAGMVFGSLLARNPHMTKISVALWVMFVVAEVLYG